MKYIERVVRAADRISSPSLDSLLKFISQRKNLAAFIQWAEDQNIKKLDNINKFLIVPDINLGDALNQQPFIEMLKKYLPESEIHYIYQKKSFPLVQANPYVDVHHPLFTRTGIPSLKDIDVLKKVIIKNKYDLIFNFCPYLSFSALKYNQAKVIHPLRIIASVIRAYSSNAQKAHITSQLHQFGKQMARRINSSSLNQNKNKNDRLENRLYTYQALCLRAKKTAKKLGISSNKKIIFLNPDSSSPYTLIPINIQVQILKAVLSLPSVDQVLMNRGRSYKNIEKDILNQIPANLKRKVIILPIDTPIDVYAALTDKADIFISADTGPMHISAAKKLIMDSEQKFRNKTALIGIFGATPSKLYGYDSFSNEHIDSSQNAPAKIFEGHPPCKNITCVNKVFKKCSPIRCFEGIEVEEIIEYIQSLL
ncbi:MAG: glycosyltransferase family 9 protein [Acidobacteriota bacterium]